METGKVAIRGEEGLLGEVIGPRVITLSELAKERADHGLVALHQFAKGCTIIHRDDPGYPLDVGFLTHAFEEGVLLSLPCFLPKSMESPAFSKRATPMKMGM